METLTICIASVSCGGLPACGCDAYVLKFLPYVFFSGNPYRGICADDVDPNTKRVRFQLVVTIGSAFRKRRLRSNGLPLMKITRETMRVKFTRSLQLGRSAWVGISIERTPSARSHLRRRDWLF